MNFATTLLGAQAAKGCKEEKVSSCVSALFEVVNADDPVVDGAEAVVDAASVRAAEGAAASYGRVFWSINSRDRGFMFEELEHANLPPNFKTIDDFDFASGTATSLKTLDTTASSYQSYGSINSITKKYIDKLVSFSGDSTGGTRVLASDIRSRVLRIGIPPYMTAAQGRAMYSSFAYAQSRGVTLTWVVIG